MRITKEMIIVASIGIIIWICGINVSNMITGKFTGMNLFGCTFMSQPIIFIEMADLNLEVTDSTQNSNLINGLSKFSLLIYLFHANYFWLTYGKYAWIEYLYDNGLPILGAVGVTIV